MRVSTPRVRQKRPSLKDGYVTTLMANSTYGRTNKEPRQNDSLNPKLGWQGSELVAFTHTAMGGQQVHFSRCNAVLTIETAAYSG
jgi:hypothetical protein